MIRTILNLMMIALVKIQTLKMGKTLLMERMILLQSTMVGDVPSPTPTHSLSRSRARRTSLNVSTT